MGGVLGAILRLVGRIGVRRGMIEGKGEMETWYLVGSRHHPAALPPERLTAAA